MTIPHTEGRIVSEWMFRALMQGQTIEEIIERAKEPKPSPEHVRESILRERAKFEDACLRKVLSNAREGNVDAIDWLAKRGLFGSVKVRDEA